MKSIFRITLLLSVIFSVAKADPIYIGKDAHGRSVYTSKPTGSESAVAELPPLARDSELGSNIAPLYSCQPHGGIDCQVGQDSDGSVICRDAFRDAAARFVEHCIEARLGIGDLITSGSDGAFRVLIRNSAAVEARAVVVSYRPKLGKRIALIGPASIEPFGVAEFEFVPTERLLYGTKPLAAQIMLQCENC